MKINKRLRKAFTLVELVVVIAIIAILSTVSVVTYFGITNSAKKSVDDTLITELNKCLQLDETINGKPNTPSEALEAVEENGFTVEKMTPTQDKKEIVWHQTTNKFELVDEIKENTTDVTTWRFLSDYTDNHGYSVYLKEGNEATSLDITTGLDVGKNTEALALNYKGSDAGQSVTIKSNSAESVINVDAPNDEVQHYGDAQEVNIVRVKMGTYIEYGNITGNINIAKGKVELANDASVTNIVIKSMTASDNTVVTPTSNTEVAIVVNEKADVATVTSNLDSISSDAITSGGGKENTAIIENNDDNVVYIGSTGYTSINEAILNVKNNDVITLVKDINVNNSFVFNNVTSILDLNGHNISANKEPLFYVKNNANLTLKNSQVEKGVISSTKIIIQSGILPNSNKKDVIPSAGNVTIEKNVTLSVEDNTQRQPTIFIVYGSKLNVYGQILNTGSCAIQGNGTDNNAQRATIINLHKGAILKTDKLAIYHPQLGTLNIDGATVEGYAGIGIKSGTLNITNNAIIRGVANDPVLNDTHSITNGINYDGSAIVVDSYVGYAGNMNISISDSTVESLHSYAIKEIKSSSCTVSNVVSLSISGNSVINSANPNTTTGDIYVKEASSVKISGGTFSKEIYGQYIESGYHSEQDGDKWIVKK